MSLFTYVSIKSFIRNPLQNYNKFRKHNICQKRFSASITYSDIHLHTVGTRIGLKDINVQYGTPNRLEQSTEKNNLILNTLS